MKISMVIYGTRGDVQPMIALALGLQKVGHEGLICAPVENEELVRRYDLPFAALGSSIKQALHNEASKKKHPKTQPSPKFLKREIIHQINQLPEVIRDADLVLGVGFVFGLPIVADYLKIPYRFMAFYPALMGPGKKDPAVGRVLWSLAKTVTNLVLKGFINKQRATFGLTPIADVWESWMGERVFIASDAALAPVPDGVQFVFTQTAYMHLPSKTGLSDELERFLSAGTPPVFVGFGSNPIHDTDKLSRLLLETADKAKQRFIISTGWADLPVFERRNDCFFVEEVPYELLFPRVAAVVHHGGIGTATIAARAGVPQICLPFMADQFQNSKQIVKLGLGPKSSHFKNLSVNGLSDAIVEVMSNEHYKKNAKELSKRIHNVDGVGMTVEVIEKEMNYINHPLRPLSPISGR